MNLMSQNSLSSKFNKYLTSSRQDLFFAFIIGIVYYIANLDVSGSAYQQDEIGYLVNGAFFAGYIIDGFSSY